MAKSDAERVEYARQYRMTEASRERNRRYARSERGRATHRAAVAADPVDRKRARKAVELALLRGALVKGPCAVCGSAQVHAHHHKGYAVEHRLDFVWLCALHHKQAHADRPTQASDKEKP